MSEIGHSDEVLSAETQGFITRLKERAAKKRDLGVGVRKEHYRGGEIGDEVIRPFDYFTQPLTDNGSSPVWDRMLANIRRQNPVSGIVLPDDTLLWSDNAPSHESLLRAIGKTDVDIYGLPRIVMNWDADSHDRPYNFLTLSGYDTDPSRLSATAAYLQRSIRTDPAMHFHVTLNAKDSDSKKFEYNGSLAKFVPPTSEK